ncbi:MAG: hypothetical protein QS721_04305 [Candidatus Endonucleobacter sp. (ex Gigantidas childressi)]|nr:hypothetical protein [Candidatus Endonucleobacter sp. (ex Gigantidas childressi)]
MKVGLKILLLLISCGFSSLASAYEMGVINILSSIGEPLDANIIISGKDVNEAGPIIVNMASKIEFMRNRTSRSYYISDLKTSIKTNNNGNKIIKIKSSKPVSVKNINLLVMMLTTKGKSFGKYKFVLPDTRATKVAPIVAKNIMVKNRHIQVAQIGNNHTHNISNKAEHKIDNTVINGSKDVDIYKVLQGDSLSSISIKLISKYPQLKSWKELMNLVVEINLDVFPNNDINKLNVATILKLPNVYNVTPITSKNMIIKSGQTQIAQVYNNNTQKTPYKTKRNRHNTVKNYNKVVTTYKVLPGESVSSISVKLLPKYPQFQSWKELMNLVVEINLDAFPNNDINKLNVATILKLPDVYVSYNKLTSTQPLVADISNTIENTEDPTHKTPLVSKDNNTSHWKVK